MAKTEKSLEVVKKYHFRKNGVLENMGYDWIGEGEACFELYPVELNEKLGFADSNGEIVIPIIYDNMKLDKLSEDLIPVAIDKKWGFVNVKTKETQVKPAYNEVGFFKNGFAPVCINNKWGMIDTNGNMIVKPKYLLDSYFEGDFTIMFEGGSWRPWGHGFRMISDSNCKIVNKKGYEIVSDCSWIDRTGINTFTLQREENGKTVKAVKQFIAFPDYIVVINDGDYLEGYITAEGKYLEKPEYDEKLKKWSDSYTNAKYVGGGSVSVIDYTGKTIEIPDYKLKEVKESLLA